MIRLMMMMMMKTLAAEADPDRLHVLPPGSHVAEPQRWGLDIVAHSHAWRALLTCMSSQRPHCSLLICTLKC